MAGMRESSNVGQYILKCIKTEKSTQREVCQVADIHTSNLSEIIRGSRHLTIPLARKLECWLSDFNARQALIIQLDQELNHASK